MRVWNEKTITDALAIFALEGEAIVSCDSPDHANRFRTTVYNYIRRRNLSFDIQLSVSGADVLFQVPRTERAEIKTSTQSQKVP